MSWSIEEHIGEGRPWPEQVVVYRGETGESLTYARRSLSDVNKMVELMDTLAAESDRLRELCEDMLSCIEIQIAFDRTPKKRMYKEFAGRARELGVEVDDG